MATREDLLAAKQQLSARLLKMGLRGNVVGMMAALRVDRAVAAAGHNVHAIGIGRKVVEDRITDTLCVRIYVVQKLAESLLPPRDRIHDQVNGIPTDVIESPPAFLLHARTRRRPPRRRGAPTPSAAAVPACTTKRKKKQRPLVAGISVGHYEITAGTIGYLCRSTRSGDQPSHVYLLSNNHVLANVNQAQVGDDIYQPGPADGGQLADSVADLTRWVQIRLGGVAPNRVDAAIARLRTDVSFTAEVCSIGPIVGTATAVEDLRVRKHGRTSGYTEGVVTDVAYDVLVGMDHNDPSVVALFESQMRIERIDPYPWFGLGGDSGSLVVSQAEPTAAGLYFAGPDSGVYGVANHIQDVLTELEIKLA